MRVSFEGDPKDEARMRVGDTGPRNIIQWVSKAWTDHELKLPVFYRETLARLLVLERFRNLIETNISAGAALYTDHKPGLFEESVSNKGQIIECLENSGDRRSTVNCRAPLQTRVKNALGRPTLKNLRIKQWIL
jgi:hypothetical protein